eukprot:13849834-Alexandrium_andersonii.AAC.1
MGTLSFCTCIVPAHAYAHTGIVPSRYMYAAQMPCVCTLPAHAYAHAGVVLSRPHEQLLYMCMLQQLSSTERRRSSSAQTPCQHACRTNASA